MALTIWQLDAASLTPYYDLAICKALAEAGHHVHYLTSKYLYDQHLPFSDLYTTEFAYFRGLDRQWLINYSRLRKLLRAISYPFDNRRVLQKIKQQRPDIVHFQWSRLPQFDIHLIREIKALNIPVVHTIHNVKSSFASQQAIRQLGNVYTQVDKLVLHAEANGREFLALYSHISAEKIAILPFINTPYEHKQGFISQTELRQTFNLPMDSFVLLSFGFIRQYKRLDLLLDAFQKAYQTSPNLRLLIAGTTETAQDQLDIDRARQIEGVVVDQRFVPTEEMWKYFAAADVAVLPYQNITQSAALIQAMNFAKPVIVSDVGAFPESVDTNGWIVPRDNIDALTSAILEAANSRDKLPAMSARSAEIIRTRHDSKAVAAKLIDIYQSLL